MAEVTYKSDIDALWLKSKMELTHALAISGANLKLTRQHYVDDGQGGLTPSGSAIELSSITKSSVQSWLELGIFAYKNSLALSDIPGKGVANGLAELDANGLVPSSQLPSYVDDVLEYASKSAFPATGTSGKIYVAIDTNLTYRWSGSEYTEISPSLALGETSSTAYRGDRGKTAYTHATDASRLATAKSSGFYKFATTAEGHIASVAAVTASDLTSLIGSTTYAPYNSAGYLPLSGGTMANTNVVTKLNADLLDGQHSSYFQPKVSVTGNETTPVYISAEGTFSPALTYAGGTKVTLNGSNKGASTASFYAPTGAGASGQILKSTAGTPEWINQSALVAGKATILETTRTLWGQNFNGSANVTGDLSSVGNIAFQASGKNIGGTLYFDTTNHFLGINKSTPDCAFDVDGEIHAAKSIVSIGGGVIAGGIGSLFMSGAGGGGTVTGINFDSAPTPIYEPMNGVITLPDYPTWNTLSGKPNLATVATTGSYNDLTDKMTNATASKAGLMSAAHYSKLESIALILGTNGSWSMTVGSNTVTQSRIGTTYINNLS